MLPDGVHHSESSQPCSATKCIKIQLSALFKKFTLEGGVYAYPCVPMQIHIGRSKSAVCLKALCVDLVICKLCQEVNFMAQNKGPYRIRMSLLGPGIYDVALNRK